jgi:hypothetical protein
VERYRLITMAGLIWFIMGCVLVTMAMYWYRASPDALLLGLFIGSIFGPVLHRLKVKDLALMNVQRMRSMLPDANRLPLVEVQSRRTYIIIALMIVMGSVLRRSSMPRLYLAPGYLVMGIALIMASGQYFKAKRPTTNKT